MKDGKFAAWSRLYSRVELSSSKMVRSRVRQETASSSAGAACDRYGRAYGALEEAADPPARSVAPSALAFKNNLYPGLTSWALDAAPRLGHKPPQRQGQVIWHVLLDAA